MRQKKLANTLWMIPNFFCIGDDNYVISLQSVGIAVISNFCWIEHAFEMISTFLLAGVKQSQMKSGIC